MGTGWLAGSPRRPPGSQTPAGGVRVRQLGEGVSVPVVVGGKCTGCFGRRAPFVRQHSPKRSVHPCLGVRARMGVQEGPEAEEMPAHGRQVVGRILNTSPPSIPGQSALGFPKRPLTCPWQ